MRAAHAAAMDESRRSPWPAVFGWCFLIFAGAAIGYGFWAMNGSGEPIAVLDIGPHAAALSATPPAAAPPPRRRSGAESEAALCREFGPLYLEPAMSPVRVELHAEVAPIGTTRQSWEIALSDPAGGVAWEQRGTLAVRNEEAPLTTTTTRVMEFAVRRAGTHRFRVLLPEGSTDDLRALRLEVRTHVVSADRRWLSGLGALALLSLALQIVASRRPRSPFEVETEEPERFREAA